VIYLAGRHIVEYDIIRKRQSYITKSVEDDDVTAMTYHKNKKNALKVAVGLKGSPESFPRVKVYNTAKNSTASLMHPDLPNSSTIIDLAFGLKGKVINSDFV
jgi:hypothetical protein